jgi:hypothetical protein
MSTDDWLFFEYKVTSVSEVMAPNGVGFVEGLGVMNETVVRNGGTIYQTSINLTDE